MEKKVCVLGASGYYGVPLCRELAKTHEVVGATHSKILPGHSRIDITDEAQVRDFIHAQGPDVVINLVAVTDVDLCEQDKELARRVNLEGTRNVARACARNGAKLFQFSTDFVFDGEKGDYSENDATHPINYYGETKRRAELEVLARGENAVIRTSTPYGTGESKKFVNNAIEKLSRSEPVNAFADTIRSPTFVDEFAQNFALLLEKDFAGVLHLAGDSQISMYDAALEVASVFGFDGALVRKSSVSSVLLAAKRPLDTGLDISCSKRLGLRMSSFHEGLEKFKNAAKATTPRARPASH